MSVIIQIFLQNILPLFFLIGLGFVLDRRFNLQITTLTKINFYLFVPSFTFVNLYTTDIRLDAVKAFIITLLILGTNYGLSFVLAKIKKYPKSMTYAFQNAVMFYNSGNIGIPLVTLVFSTGIYLIGDEAPYLTLALSIQVMILVVQNVSVNTFGFFNAGRASLSIRQALVNVLKMPTVYMVPLAFLLKLVPYDIRVLPIWPVLNYARNGLVPIALLSLGIQLSKSKLKLDNRDVYLAIFTRLVIGPILALLFIWLFGMEGLPAQVVFISASVPTAVNSALIAVENDNHPDFATQVVIMTTILSALTMTGVIYLSNILFPVI
ncbi:MAG: AEC family transporter [Clostridiales bacterium]|nr:AEC family transporter [Clostridiales bacterium]